MSLYQVQSDPKQIRRDVRGVVLCVGAFIITMSIVSSIVLVVAMFLENPAFLASFAGSGTDYTSMTMDEEFNRIFLDVSVRYSGLASIIGMICGLPWFFLIRGKNFLTKDVTRKHSNGKISTILILFVCILGIQFFMTMIQIWLELLFGSGGSSATDALDETTTSLATSFWGALYIVIIGPICEELVFRGAVMRKLERYGANFAIIVSSLLFGLYHIILFQAVFAFLIGIILAYTAGRFSLKWAILLHVMNNGLVVFSVFLNNELFNVVMGIVYILAFVATILILVLHRRLLRAQRVAGAPSEARVFSRAFASPWLILYILGCVASGILLLGII